MISYTILIFQPRRAVQRHRLWVWLKNQGKVEDAHGNNYNFSTGFCGAGFKALADAPP
jgi:hypothetical protein